MACPTVRHSFGYASHQRAQASSMMSASHPRITRAQFLSFYSQLQQTNVMLAGQALIRAGFLGQHQALRHLLPQFGNLSHTSTLQINTGYDDGYYQWNQYSQRSRQRPVGFSVFVLQRRP